MDSLQQRLQPALSCLDVGVQEGKHLQLRRVQFQKMYSILVKITNIKSNNVFAKLYTWLLDSITPTILVLIRPALLGCLISLTFSMMMRLGMRMIMRMTLIRCHIRTVPPCPPCCPPSSGASLPGVARCWHRRQGESQQGGGGEIG